MTDPKLVAFHFDLSKHSTPTHIALANILANDICTSSDPAAKRMNLLAFLEVAKASETDFAVLCGLKAMEQPAEPESEPEPQPEPAPASVPAKPGGFSIKRTTEQ